MEASAGGTISTPTPTERCSGFGRGRPRRGVARHGARGKHDGRLVRVQGLVSWCRHHGGVLRQPRHDRAAGPEAAKVVADGTAGYRARLGWRRRCARPPSRRRPGAHRRDPRARRRAELPAGGGAQGAGPQHIRPTDPARRRRRPRQDARDRHDPLRAGPPRPR